MRYACGGIALSLVAAMGIAPLKADPIKRAATPAGAVIDRKVGEEVRFVNLSDWQGVELHQDLLGGDLLRTNAIGQLAVLFADHTQVRLGRNSSLQVRKMGPGEDTILNLQSGTMWARAQRGGTGLTVETPAAAAAIRGTDWTLSVKGNQTSLIVLEGKVELRNEHGAVQVAKGEAAVATIGQAPRKLVIVAPEDREQMLFYLTLRSGFTFMPATNLNFKDMRAERDRLSRKPDSLRTSEDWLVLAEIQLTLDSRQTALALLARARSSSLSASQRARANLVEALVAGAQKNYSQAAELFHRAESYLDGSRRAIAAYGGYYARSLLDPKHSEAPPKHGSGVYAAVMKAYTAGFLEDIPAAIRMMKEAEVRYPRDATLPALRALLALLINDRMQMSDAVDRSLSIDPADPNGLIARARLKAGYRADSKGALADLETAIAVSPGNSMAWNDLGLLQDQRGARREAELAFRKAIELDPEDPVGHANIAVHYLDQSRMLEAKREIDAALAADSSFSIALLARGRYYLQTGETEKAIDDLLAASTANPGYSQAQVMLAAGHYELGDRDPFNQALENADRLDKNDPVIPAIRTAIAIDDYDADTAIRSAQEFLRRARGRGGDYGALGANHDAGSTLNNAFRLQGLEAWGRYYGDAVFDPFQGSGYADQAIRGSVNPYANAIASGSLDVISNQGNTSSFSSLFQGLMLDPHMLSGRSRSATLLHTPFFEGSLGGGINIADGHTRRIGTGEIQGFSNTGVPVSFYGNLQWEQLPGDGDYPGFGNFSTEGKVLSGNGYVTSTITPDDRLVAYANKSRSDFALDALTLDPSPSLRLNNELFIPFFGFPLAPAALPLSRTQDNSASVVSGGLGWSHTFGYENVLNGAIFYTQTDIRNRSRFDFDQAPVLGAADPDFVPFGQTRQEARTGSYIASVSHSIGDDDITWRYGIEGGWIDAHTRDFSELFALAPPIVGDITAGPTTADGRIGIGRAYMDGLYEITPQLKAEYAAFITRLGGDNLATGGDLDKTRFEPRIGLAWSPHDDQWLRAGFLRQSVDIGTPTLAPIGILGLQPNQFVTGLQGYTDTFAFEWDAQWSDRLFTSVEYQHQDLHDFSIALPVTALPAVDALSLSRGRIDRVSATANIALGNGFGLSGTAAFANSKNDDPAALNSGGALPYIPSTAGRVALTWVNEANIKATIAGNFIGRRDGDDIGTELGSLWTLDANMIWEPLDKRFAVEAAAYNLLDRSFDVATGVPGGGRAFKATLKVRF